jgi:hypothetical protein
MARPRKEHILRVSENRALRRILTPERGEIIGGSRKLCKEELHIMYSSPNSFRVIK